MLERGVIWKGLLFLALTTAVAVRADQGSTSARRELDAIDQAFVTAYGHSIKQILSDTPPTFLVLGDKLVLYRQGQRQERPLIPPVFDELKTIAHVALSVFAIISPANGQALRAAQRADLHRLRDSIAPARSAIQRVGLTPAQVQRQEQILTASAETIDRSLDQGALANTALVDFCRRMRPLVEANVNEAVPPFLDELNRHMAALLPQLTASERQHFLVIVTGVHQARHDNSVMQYFTRLLGDPPPITQRVIYAENVSGEAGALHLLGVHQMEKRVGEAFFDNPYYMNSDLLGQPASAYLPTMQLPPLDVK
jgi:hypothetical protein